MLTAAVALAPVVGGMAAGQALRRLGTAGVRDGQFLLLLNLWVCMPALVFRALSGVEPARELALFPALAAGSVLAGYVLGRVAVSRFDVGGSPQRGVVLMAFMVVNAAFALPFVDALYGDAGVARLAAFDVVNNILVLTAVSTVASRAGSRPGTRGLWRPLVGTPPLYAIAAGLAVNLTGVDVPEIAGGPIDTFAAASPFAVAIGAGILFRPTRDRFRQAATIAAGRIILGLTLAVTLVLLLDLDGVDRGVVLLLGAAPVGFVTVAFAALERLDDDLAAQVLAWSLLGGLVASVAVALVA
ncbi:AEC family transporter [Aeromicrobium sp. CF4.19]|uniref:AEC family transporter n=1 Tax=Aeromicrobium sp. CF4.19 TaxID=3373082 RepID=UPI003EE6003A